MPAVGVDWQVQLVDASGSAVAANDTELPAASVYLDAFDTAATSHPMIGAMTYGRLAGATTESRVTAHDSTLDTRGTSLVDLGVAAKLSYFNPGGPNLWERARNNVDVTLLASSGRTTTQTSADITTYNAQGIHVVLDMTTVGTASVTVTINGKDAVSGKYYLLLSGAVVSSNSTNVYKIYPGLPATANVSANDHLPRVIQIVVTANNANSGVYSVGYCLLI